MCKDTRIVCCKNCIFLNPITILGMRHCPVQNIHTTDTLVSGCIFSEETCCDLFEPTSIPKVALKLVTKSEI